MEHISSYAADNILGRTINIIKKNTAMLEAFRNFGVQVNTEKTMYMFMSHHQNAGKNHNLIIS